MSPRKGDPRIREDLLARAQELFLSQGFAATGIEQICAAAGVSKGALFHHFRDKRELALEVLERWTRAGFRAYAGAPFAGAPTAVERVIGYVSFTIDLGRHAPVGCLVGTFAQEVSSSHPELRSRCARAFRAWSAGLAGMLDEAQREARCAPFDSESVARHFVAVFEGAQILAKVTRSRAPLAEHLEHVGAYLRFLFEKESIMKRARQGATTRVKRGASGDEVDPGFAPVVAAFARDRTVERSKMFGSVGLKVCGKVFAMCVKGALVVKLPAERAAELIASKAATMFDPGHGKPMKEWVSISGTRTPWVDLAEEAHAFVKGLAR